MEATGLSIDHAAQRACENVTQPPPGVWAEAGTLKQGWGAIKTGMVLPETPLMPADERQEWQIYGLLLTLLDRGVPKLPIVAKPGAQSEKGSGKLTLAVIVARVHNSSSRDSYTPRPLVITGSIGIDLAILLLLSLNSVY